ncbi:hypothetical protein TWF694_011082 [Orbilia ellipsospora]|uniref:DUF7605 domain-containing protein n=1 Tax=Orbilia ellipsospora TaxID=2528407 RepID=A0AAV9X8A3_9PEZI
MKKGLFTLRETCSNEIGKEIESLIKETDQLSLNSVKYCKKVQSKARQELNWQTYRVICARGGDYSNSKRHTDKNLNLNSKFLGAIDDKLANTWSKSMDKIRRSLNNYTVKFSIQLNVFKERWMSILYEHCGIGSKDIGSNKNDITNALQGMSLGTEKLYLDQTQRVDQQQRDLNRDFRSTNRMRDALMNAYQEASDETGPGLYDRMIDIIDDALEKTAVFNDIKDIIATGLKKLEDDLHKENENWSQSIGEELETNIKNWLSLTDKVEQDEMEGKQKLKLIVTDFKGTMQLLIDEAKVLGPKMKL